MFNLNFYTKTGFVRKSIRVPAVFVRKLIEFNITDLMPTQQIQARGSGEKWTAEASLLTPESRAGIADLIQKVLVAILTEMILGLKVAVLSGKPLNAFLEQATFVADVCSQVTELVFDRRTAYFGIG